MGKCIYCNQVFYDKETHDKYSCREAARAEIAELKKEAKDYCNNCLRVDIIARLTQQLTKAKDTIAKLEEHLQELCPHDGESKNNVCLECGKLL